MSTCIVCLCVYKHRNTQYNLGKPPVRKHLGIAHVGFQPMWAVKTKEARYLWLSKVGLAVYMRGYLRSICTILQAQNKFPNWEFITQASPTIEHIILILLVQAFAIKIQEGEFWLIFNIAPCQFSGFPKYNCLNFTKILNNCLHLNLFHFFQSQFYWKFLEISCKLWKNKTNLWQIPGFQFVICKAFLW